MKTFQDADETNKSMKDYPEDEELQRKNFDALKYTHAIEEQTGKLPWVSWVGLSVASLGASVTLMAFDRKHAGLGIGLLAPCFLLIGVYNKIARIDAILESDTNTVHSSVH